MQINDTVNSVYQLSSNHISQAQQAHQGVSFQALMLNAKSATALPTTVLPTTEQSSTGTSFLMNTSHGDQSVDLVEYITPKPVEGSVSLMDIPLLLPTAHNVDTLSKFSEEQFKGLLDQYNISAPPATIEFDAEGKLVLPAGYPYSSELKQAFADNPGVENALRTTTALASHYAGIMEGAAFRDEMATARNQADQNRIVQKYEYLFDDDRPAAQIVLAFLEDGSMLVGEKSA